MERVRARKTKTKTVACADDFYFFARRNKERDRGRAAARVITTPGPPGRHHNLRRRLQMKVASNSTDSPTPLFPRHIRTINELAQAAGIAVTPRVENGELVCDW